MSCFLYSLVVFCRLPVSERTFVGIARSNIDCREDWCYCMGQMDVRCVYCGAMYFASEVCEGKFNKCCKDGKMRFDFVG